MPFVKERYPVDWPAISRRIRDRSGGKCEFCGAQNYQPHPVTGSRVVLTVAHLDHDTRNNADDNLRALCQRCHLSIQAKVIMERPWMLGHSEWFKPYVAGYYAHQRGLPDDRESVLARVDELIALGQGLEVSR
mgnify:CR=1 FL=1